ncbi:uncharacterized protein LY79DRAFT_189139 [Colletotrichum navitas]|uniref:Uncharacterized protein n=1 Tax=Colletotrichum navitas TaxID=681940 RepID=A0AAD8Q0J9_9PEZI|nr:uncharacterized protein LY79DRAFT_189139 [Colletotrichum navitas]KAK1593155.1 hypothetical protein LY79DRAFT_189139 [Colletotrichum navitas]
MISAFPGFFFPLFFFSFFSFSFFFMTNLAVAHHGKGALLHCGLWKGKHLMSDFECGISHDTYTRSQRGVGNIRGDDSEPQTGHPGGSSLTSSFFFFSFIMYEYHLGGRIVLPKLLWFYS